MLFLQPTHLQSIKQHAAETYPHECCGLMLGKVNADMTEDTLVSAEPFLRPRVAGAQKRPNQCDHGDTNELETTRIVVELWPVKNEWDETAQMAMAQVEENALAFSDDTYTASGHNDQSEQSLTTRRRYWIDPKDLLKAQKYARKNELSIIGIYHSHPDHPAVPSECDRACAWPEYSYIIVSVPHGKATDVFSWTLDDDHQFQSEELIVS